MRGGRWIAGLLMYASLLAGCGSSHKTASNSSTAGAQPPPPQGPPATIPAGAPPAVKAIAGRVLVAGDIPGLPPQGPPGQRLHGVILGISARSWVEEEAREGLPPNEQASERTRLQRLGFVRAVHERLAAARAAGPEGVSIAIEFRSASGAQANVQYEAKAAERHGLKPFAVAGIPGAKGFGQAGGGMTDYNVAFSKGAYYYLVGVGYPTSAPGAPTREQLIAAARRLYARVPS